MEFRILGPLEVREEGRVLKLGGAKQRALLALLLLHANEPVSRDRLIEELWPDHVPGTASTAIQVHVSQLRKALGRDRIVTQRPGYLIRVREGELDVDRFEQLAAQARGREPADAARLLRQALGLWRGPPLAELDVSFAATERARLEEQRLAALEQRIESDLDLGRHAELVPELEGLVREHPLRERLRGQLMVALYRCGRQAESLEVYRSGRRQLDEQLGLEPGEELRRLERAILEQDPSLAAPTPRGPLPPPSVPTGTVTFLFTDVEGSTRLVRTLGDEYGTLLARHHTLLREAFTEQGGQEIDSQGDALFFAFRRARDAVRASVRAQLEFAAATWPGGVEVRIRIGIHTGEPPGLVEGGYHGLDVVRAARISGTAHGGQILVSSATRDLVGDAVPDISFRDLGEHRLKDIAQPERLYQAVAQGLREDFPFPRVEAAARVMTIGGREEELAVAAEAALETEERRVRLFRRSWVVALIGAVLLGGTVAGVVLALTGGSNVRVAVVPNSVAVIDPASNQVVDDVPVGSRPVAVAVGEGAVWVANADDGTVMRIDPETRKVVKTIGIGAEVSDLAVGFGSVWVAGGNDRTLVQIDPRENAAQRTLSFGGARELVPTPVFSVAVGAGAVWITRGNRLLRIDPQTYDVKRVPIEPPLGLTVGAGSVWVTTLIDHVLRFEPRTLAHTGTFSLPTAAIAPIVGGEALWVIEQFLPRENVWAMNPDTGDPTATLRGGPSASDLAWGANSLWSAASGTVTRIRNGQAVARIPVGQRSSGVAVGYGVVWVTVKSARD